MWKRAGRGRPSAAEMGRAGAPWACAVVLLAVWGAAGGQGSGPDEAARRGLAVATEVERRDAGFGAYEAEGLLTNRKPGGGASEHEFVMITVEIEGDGDRRLIHIRRPPALRGMAFLAHAHALRPDDLWLALPGEGRVRRIASRKRTGRFLGSEFTLEDLAPFQVEKYRYRYLREEPCGDGRRCHVVENVPRYAYSGYSRQVEWVDREIYQPRRIEYYNRAGVRVKVLEFWDYRRFEGRWWRPMRMRMSNLRTGARSDIVWRQYRFGAGYRPDDLTPLAFRELVAEP